MKYITLILIVFLTSCASGPQSPANLYDTNPALFYPQLDNFPSCRSYGCKIIDHVGLTTDEQKQIRALFKHDKNAEQERKTIAQAIGLTEQFVGAKTGTSADVAGTYVKLGHMQQDCIDESTNTTTYLILLNEMGLLKFHDVNALTSRPPIFSGRLGPHRTAVIIDKDTQIKYAVDSWFHDNGKPAEIVELDTWRWGWHPDK